MHCQSILSGQLPSRNIFDCELWWFDEPLRSEGCLRSLLNYFEMLDSSNDREHDDIRSHLLAVNKYHRSYQNIKHRDWFFDLAEVHYRSLRHVRWGWYLPHLLRVYRFLLQKWQPKYCFRSIKTSNKTIQINWMA